jgi:hypothetical protein
VDISLSKKFDAFVKTCLHTNTEFLRRKTMYYQLRRSFKLKDLSTEAWNDLRKIRDYIKNLTPEANVEVFTTKFGEKGIIIFTADFKDLNSLDDFQKRIREDTGYQEILKNMPDIFFPGTWHDEVLHTF